MASQDQKERARKLDSKVPVLTVSQEIFVRALQTEITDFEFTEEPKCPFATFIVEDCVMPGITNNEELEVLTVTELISARAIEVDCCSAF